MIYSIKYFFKSIHIFGAIISELIQAWLQWLSLMYRLMRILDEWLKVQIGISLTKFFAEDGSKLTGL